MYVEARISFSPSCESVSKPHAVIQSTVLTRIRGLLLKVHPRFEAECSAIDHRPGAHQLLVVMPCPAALHTAACAALTDPAA